MPRLTAAKRLELEAFRRSHPEGWRRSDLNQRDSCELHGLPLKRFGNWRAKLKHEEPASAGKLLYRRGGGLRHMSGHMSRKEIGQAQTAYLPSARSTPPGGRRRFSKADKQRIVEEAGRPGASMSGVARQYGIDTSLHVPRGEELEACRLIRTSAFVPSVLQNHSRALRRKIDSQSPLSGKNDSRKTPPCLDRCAKTVTVRVLQYARTHTGHGSAGQQGPLVGQSPSFPRRDPSPAAMASSATTTRTKQDGPGTS